MVINCSDDLHIGRNMEKVTDFDGSQCTDTTVMKLVPNVSTETAHCYLDSEFIDILSGRSSCITNGEIGYRAGESHKATSNLGKYQCTGEAINLGSKVSMDMDKIVDLCEKDGENFTEIKYHFSHVDFQEIEEILLGSESCGNRHIVQDFSRDTPRRRLLLNESKKKKIEQYYPKASIDFCTTRELPKAKKCTRYLQKVILTSNSHTNDNINSSVVVDLHDSPKVMPTQGDKMAEIENVKVKDVRNDGEMRMGKRKKGSYIDSEELDKTKQFIRPWVAVLLMLFFVVGVKSECRFNQSYIGLDKDEYNSTFKIRICYTDTKCKERLRWDKNHHQIFLGKIRKWTDTGMKYAIEPFDNTNCVEMKIFMVSSDDLNSKYKLAFKFQDLWVWPEDQPIPVGQPKLVCNETNRSFLLTSKIKHGKYDVYKSLKILIERQGMVELVNDSVFVEKDYIAFVIGDDFQPCNISMIYWYKENEFILIKKNLDRKDKETCAVGTTSITDSDGSNNIVMIVVLISVFLVVAAVGSYIICLKRCKTCKGKSLRKYFGCEKEGEPGQDHDTAEPMIISLV